MIAIKALAFSLRFRLIVLVLIAGLPGMGLAVYNANQQMEEARHRAQEQMLHLALLTAGEHQALVTSTRQLLATLAELPDLRPGRGGDCDALLARLLAIHSIYANFGVANLAGDVVCSAVPLTAPVNASDRAWFIRTLQARDFAVGDYQIGRITGKAVIVFGYPILDERGEMAAVAFAALGLGWLERLTESAALPEEAVYTVVDQQGVILARHPDGAEWIGKPSPEGSVVARVLGATAEGLAEAPGVDGVTRLYAYAPLLAGGAPAAYVIVGMPLAQAYAAVNRSLWWNLGFLGSAVLLALAAAWIGDEAFLLQRIHALLAATRRIARGDLSARTGVRYGMGELSQLARAFDEMAESLERQHRQRERAEVALRESQQRLAHLLAVSPAIIYTLNPDGCVPTWISPNVAFRLGYTPEEALQPRWWADHLHPEDREQALARAAGIFAEGHMVLEYRFFKKDGKLIWVHDELRLLRDEQGNPLAIVGAWTDITGRKQAEEQLRLQATALETAADAIFITDRDGFTQWVNPAFTALTGYTPEEAVGQTMRLLKSGQHDQAFYQNLWQTLLSGQVWRGELVNRRKDGSLYDAEEIIAPVRASNREITHFVAIQRDITERKRLTRQLAQQVETLTTLYHGARKLAESLDMEAVAQGVAQFCVENLGVRLAWLGRAEADGRVTLISQFPTDHPYPSQITVRWDETPQGQGPTGRALRSGLPEVIADVLADPGFAPWRPIAERYGFRAAPSSRSSAAGTPSGRSTCTATSPASSPPSGWRPSRLWPTRRGRPWRTPVCTRTRCAASSGCRPCATLIWPSPAAWTRASPCASCWTRLPSN